jgi:uncharacterized protein (TIGR03067 family)
MTFFAEEFFMCPVTLLLLGALLGADDRPAAPQTELSRLDGTWRLVGGEEVGTVLTREEAWKEEEEFIFKGDTLTIRTRGKVVVELKVAIDPSKNPNEMDFVFPQGNNVGKKCLGIYSLSGDQLKICLETKLRPSRGGPRPNVFSTQKKQEAGKHPGLLLLIFERQK